MVEAGFAGRLVAVDFAEAGEGGEPDVLLRDKIGKIGTGDAFPVVVENHGVGRVSVGVDPPAVGRELERDLRAMRPGELQVALRRKVDGEIVAGHFLRGIELGGIDLEDGVVRGAAQAARPEGRVHAAPGQEGLRAALVVAVAEAMFADETAAGVGGAAAAGLVVRCDDGVAVGDADIASEVEAVCTRAGARPGAEIPVAVVDAVAVELIGEEQLVARRGRGAVRKGRGEEAGAESGQESELGGKARRG